MFVFHVRIWIKQIKMVLDKGTYIHANPVSSIYGINILVAQWNNNQQKPL